MSISYCLISQESIPEEFEIINIDSRLNRFLPRRLDHGGSAAAVMRGARPQTYRSTVFRDLMASLLVSLLKYTK